MNITLGKKVYVIEPVGGRAWGMSFACTPILLKATIVHIFESITHVPTSVIISIDPDNPSLKYLDEDSPYKELVVDVSVIYEDPYQAISGFMRRSQKFLNKQLKEMNQSQPITKETNHD